MNRLSSTDRSALIRLASSLPAGDETRRAILSGLKQVAGRSIDDENFQDFMKAAGKPPAGKYDLMTVRNEGPPDVWKKGIDEKEALKLMKRVYALIDEAQDLDGEGEDTDPIYKKIEGITRPAPFSDEHELILRDPDKKVWWVYNVDGWEGPRKDESQWRFKD